MSEIDELYKQFPDAIKMFSVPESIEITSDTMNVLEYNTLFNDIYAEYYNQLAEETSDDKWKRKAERLINCHKSWFGDHYSMQGIFDVKRVFNCHDKWCVNCQHLKQASKLKRFTKILNEVSEDHDLYLMTMTVPNVQPKKLKDCLIRFNNAFGSIIRYFSGNSDVCGIDFESYGFYACYRNLEIVINAKTFHPHYHCVLVLKKGLDENKLYTNDYSYDNGVLKRKFSDLEILIQKVLALKYNGIRLDRIVISYVINKDSVDKKKLEAWCKKKKVNLQLLNALRREGYSCTIDKIEGNSWHEAFKYATKITKDGAPTVLYYQFKVLTEILEKAHLSQGYGAFYSLPKDDDWEIDENVLAAYEFVVSKLKEIEDPVGYTYALSELVSKLREKSLKCISRRNIYKYLEEYLAEHSDTIASMGSDNSSDPVPSPVDDDEIYEQVVMKFDMVEAFSDTD